MFKRSKPILIPRITSDLNEGEAKFAAVEQLVTHRILLDASALDIDIPFEDRELWICKDADHPVQALTPKGRLFLRRAIDEEETRRREIKAWWWKTIIIPALATLTGLVGALTGLFAVIHKK